MIFDLKRCQVVVFGADDWFPGGSGVGISSGLPHLIVRSEKEWQRNGMAEEWSHAPISIIPLPSIPLPDGYPVEEEGLAQSRQDAKEERMN
jgi:hypothetical protein